VLRRANLLIGTFPGSTTKFDKSSGKQVLCKNLRLGFLMENQANELPDFNSTPSSEELEKLLHLPPESVGKSAKID
jgi:hypothetical protein